jgi:hypothetical protein
MNRGMTLDLLWAALETRESSVPHLVIATRLVSGTDSGTTQANMGGFQFIIAWPWGFRLIINLPLEKVISKYLHCSYETRLSQSH